MNDAVLRGMREIAEEVLGCAMGPEVVTPEVVSVEHGPDEVLPGLSRPLELSDRYVRQMSER